MLIWNKHVRTLLAIAMVSAFALFLGACGGDDDPVQPGGQGGSGGGGDDFDQSAALAQTTAASQEAVALVESMVGLASGVSKSADGNWNYGWNEETQRWEWDYEYSGEGYVYDWFYTVQYFNAGGDPQQGVAGAVRIDHDMMGDADYHSEQQGALVDYDWLYNYVTSISGLDTDTMTLQGNGGYDMDYRYVSAQGNYHYSYVISWQILGSGITRPRLGGCPTGSIRYDFAPYYALIVFDGTSAAQSTLYDAGGTAVPGGSHTHQLYCDVR